MEELLEQLPRCGLPGLSVPSSCAARGGHSGGCWASPARGTSRIWQAAPSQNTAATPALCESQLLAQTDVTASFMLQSWRPEQLMIIYISLLLTMGSYPPEDAEGRGWRGLGLCIGWCPPDPSVVPQG